MSTTTTGIHPITTVSGRGVPVIGDDIDTDRIIPARFLKCVTFDGLGEHAFADDRAEAFKAGGTPHPFDDPRFDGGKILVVGKNFGCGSSREHAPQALYRWGIRAVVGVDFAEIFFGNSVAIGMPCLRISAEAAGDLAAAIAANPAIELSIDLATNTLTVDGTSQNVDLPEGPPSQAASKKTRGACRTLPPVYWQTWKKTRATAAALYGRTQLAFAQ